MQKERVKKGDIILGKPIPWNAFDENGMLLLRKGQVIQSQSQLDILIARGLFHVKLENGGDSEKNVIKAPQSPFELIDNVEKRLDHLFTFQSYISVTKIHNFMTCPKLLYHSMSST